MRELSTFVYNNVILKYIQNLLNWFCLKCCSCMSVNLTTNATYLQK